MYQVPCLRQAGKYEVWNLSHVRQGLWCCLILGTWYMVPSTWIKYLGTSLARRRYLVHGTWYLVHVWNLSQVRHGLGCRYWKVDRPRDNVPGTKYQVRSMESKPCQTRTLMLSDTWYMVPSTWIKYLGTSPTYRRYLVHGTWYLVQFFKIWILLRNYLGTLPAYRRYLVHGTWYLVHVWNLSQVRQGLWCRLILGTWYLVPSTNMELSVLQLSPSHNCG